MYVRLCVYKVRVCSHVHMNQNVSRSIDCRQFCMETYLSVSEFMCKCICLGMHAP